MADVFSDPYGGLIENLNKMFLLGYQDSLRQDRDVELNNHKQQLQQQSFSNQLERQGRDQQWKQDQQDRLYEARAGLAQATAEAKANRARFDDPNAMVLTALENKMTVPEVQGIIDYIKSGQIPQSMDDALWASRASAGPVSPDQIKSDFSAILERNRKGISDSLKQSLYGKDYKSVMEGEGHAQTNEVRKAAIEEPGMLGAYNALSQADKGELGKTPANISALKTDSGIYQYNKATGQGSMLPLPATTKQNQQAISNTLSRLMQAGQHEDKMITEERKRLNDFTLSDEEKAAVASSIKTREQERDRYKREANELLQRNLFQNQPSAIPKTLPSPFVNGLVLNPSASPLDNATLFKRR